MIRPTSIVSFLFIFSVLIANIFASAKSSENLNTIALLEQIILSIATLQYTVSLGFSYDRLMRWRYLDWILTTPLLISTFYLLAVEKGFEGDLWPVIFFDILMIAGGYFAEFPETSPIQLPDKKQQSAFWFIISSLSLIVILYYIYTWNQYLQEQDVDTGILPYFFYIGWTIYGLNWLNPNPNLRQDIFSLSDLFNKGVYSLFLNRVISDNFEKTDNH